MLCDIKKRVAIYSLKAVTSCLVRLKMLAREVPINCFNIFPYLVVILHRGSQYKSKTAAKIHLEFCCPRSLLK